MSTILLKRSNTAANDSYTGILGEITIDTQKRKIRIHDNIQVGGYEVSNTEDLDLVVDTINALGISDIAGLVTALSNKIEKDGSVAFTGNIDAGDNRIINVSDPVSNSDAANKLYIDTKVSTLNNAFLYEGLIAGGANSGTATDLSTLSTKAGSYYKLSNSGYVTYNTDTQFLNLGDAVVFNNVGGYDVIDNTNSTVAGTANFVEVTGSPDTGYSVDLDSVFKSRIIDLENLDTGVSSVSGSDSISVNNNDPANPVIGIDEASTSSAGSMSSADKTKLNSVAGGAQVNTVDTVSGKTGDVTLNKSDVGLGSVDNFFTADQTQATAATSEALFSTPKGVKQFVEDGSYTIDGGTF